MNLIPDPNDWPEREGIDTIRPLSFRSGSVAIRRFGVGFSASKSVLDRSRFDLTLRGHAWMTIDGTRHELRRGVPVFRPAGLNVTSAVAGQEIVQFSILFGDDVGVSLRRPHPLTPALLVRALAAYESPDATTDLTIESYLAEMTVLLNDERDAQMDAESWLAGVTDRLHDAPFETPTLVDLARVAGVHFTTLARGFRRRLGCTPGEYLRGIRLALASQRLASGDETIGHIAYAHGFADQSHFGRWFRASFGMTPGEYRKRFARPFG